MRYRVIIAALCAAALFGCSRPEAEHPVVQGIVSSVDVQHDSFNGPPEARFIRLEGNGAVFECQLRFVGTCATVKIGDTVTIKVDPDSDSTSDNLPLVESLTYGVQSSSPSASPSSTPS